MNKKIWHWGMIGLGLTILLLTGLIVGISCYGGGKPAATRVALIPEKPELSTTADLVLAELTDDRNFAFLERAEIEKVLQERQLTAGGLVGRNLADLRQTLHADLFAVITAAPGRNTVGGLVVYDARYGFRLVNAEVSESDAVAEIVARLQQAAETSCHPERQVWIAVVAVRDAGVPERFKPAMNAFAVELERRLGDIPQTVVLERDYLDHVNQERKLTGKMFELAAAARLLRMEFEPGSEPEIVNLTVRITDAGDKELFRFAQENCLTADRQQEKFIAAITDYLNSVKPQAEKK